MRRRGAALLGLLTTATAQKMRPPKQLVVVAGAGKCGTNALAHHLAKIAGFQMSSQVAKATRKLNGFAGEVNYPCHLLGRKRTKAFVKRYGGIPPYGRCIQRSRRDKSLALDKSANYLGNPKCASHFRRAFPSVHVFATICQVSSRLWSRMNHVNRDRRHDDPSGDLSKATDWPQHVVRVAREQLAKLDAHGWNETVCTKGPATHVCKVLSQSSTISMVPSVAALPTSTCTSSTCRAIVERPSALI